MKTVLLKETNDILHGFDRQHAFTTVDHATYIDLMNTESNDHQKHEIRLQKIAVNCERTEKKIFQFYSIFISDDIQLYKYLEYWT